MKCPNCNTELSGQKYCPSCHSGILSVNQGGSNTIGNHVSVGHSIFQVNGDIMVTSSEESNRPEYEIHKKWDSEIAEKPLTVASVVAFLADVCTLIGFLYAAYNARNTQKLPSLTFLCILLVLLAVFSLAFGIALWLRDIVKKQLLLPLAFGYGISGYHGKIGLCSITGKCPICGGKLKYYNGMTEWHDVIDPINGQILKRVPKRKEPVLRCNRNHRHLWLVDPAEVRI